MQPLRKAGKEDTFVGPAFNVSYTEPTSHQPQNPFLVVQTANQLVRLNQSRVCLLHGGVEALRTAGLLELPPRGAAQQ